MKKIPLSVACFFSFFLFFFTTQLIFCLLVGSVFFTWQQFCQILTWKLINIFKISFKIIKKHILIYIMHFSWKKWLKFTRFQRERNSKLPDFYDHIWLTEDIKRILSFFKIFSKVAYSQIWLNQSSYEWWSLQLHNKIEWKKKPMKVVALVVELLV